MTSVNDSATPAARASAWPPQYILTLVALIGLAAAITATLMARDVQVPALQIVADGVELRLAAPRDAAGTPLAGHTGQRVIAFLTNDGEPLPAHATLLIEEPDTLAGYTAYNDFLAQQDRLAAMLADDALTVLLGDGSKLTIPAVARGLWQLPAAFWMQLAFGLTGWLLGGAVWAFRPADTATRLYALTGACYALAALSAAIYSTRELALPSERFFALSMLNAFGTIIFAAALLGLLWHYPRPLGRAAIFRGALGIALAMFAAHLLQIGPKGLVGPQTTVFILFVPCFPLAWLQWRGHRGEPVARAALLWFFLSVFSGTLLFATLVLAPPLFGHPPLAAQSLMLGVFLFVYVGIAAAITRYRLFDIERWWLNALLWFLGGAAIVALDMLLLLTLPMAGVTATLAAVAIVGWLYFPARQWLWRRVRPGGRASADALLRRFVIHAAATHGRHELPAMWQHVVTESFEPLVVTEAETPVPHVTIRDHGQALELPGSQHFPSLRAAYPRRGTRLFSREDVRLAEALLSLAIHSGNAIVARETGIEDERQRIMRDLHDDLGSKLLIIAHSGNEDSRSVARAALQDVRDILQALEAGPSTLHALCDACRWELQSRAEAHGFALQHDDAGIVADVALSARETTNLARILREAVTNAVRHARLTLLVLSWRFDGERLQILVRNDGVSAPPDQWHRGRGMRSMEARAADLDADIAWDGSADACWLRISLRPAALDRRRPRVQGGGKPLPAG